MNNRFIIFDSGAKKINFNTEQIVEKPSISILHESNNCPDCRVRLVRLGNCFSCPLCGYGGCS